MNDDEINELFSNIEAEAEYDPMKDEVYRKKQKRRYMSMELEELKKIKPIWATGELLEHNSLNRPDDQNNFEHVNVETKTLIEEVRFDNLDPKILFSCKSASSASNMSFVTTLYRWEKGQAVDPPTLEFNTGGCFFEFKDGNHRAILAHHLEEFCIPVAINKNSMQFMHGKIKFCLYEKSKVFIRFKSL